MNDRPSILVVGARGISGSEGGVEKFAEEFVRRVARNYRVTVHCLAARMPDDVDGVELIMTPRSNSMRTDKIFYYLVAAWICLSRRFDHAVLLGLNSAMLLPVLRLLFWRRARVVVRSGSVDYIFDKWGRVSKLYFRLAESLLRFADSVVAVSPGIQRRLASADIHSVLIRNGLSVVSVPRPIADREARHVIAVGRVMPEKNYSHLIEAARLLGQSKVSFTIVGGMDLSGEGAKLKALMEQGAVTNVTLAAQSNAVVSCSSRPPPRSSSIARSRTVCRMRCWRRSSRALRSSCRISRPIATWTCRMRSTSIRARHPISRRGSNRHSRFLPTSWSRASASRIGTK